MGHQSIAGADAHMELGRRVLDLLCGAPTNQAISKCHSVVRRVLFHLGSDRVGTDTFPPQYSCGPNMLIQTHNRTASTLCVDSVIGFRLDCRARHAQIGLPRQ